MQDFRKLRVWQKAQAQAVAIHRLLQTFPKRGFSRLKQQMQKSSEAIADTIAEGCGAVTQPELARFLSMSLRESTELEGQLDRAFKFGLMSRPKFLAYTTEVRTIRGMTVGFRKAVVRSYEQEAEPEVGEERSQTGNRVRKRAPGAG